MHDSNVSQAATALKPFGQLDEDGIRTLLECWKNRKRLTADDIAAVVRLVAVTK